MACPMEFGFNRLGFFFGREGRSMACPMEFGFNRLDFFWKRGNIDGGRWRGNMKNKSSQTGRWRGSESGMRRRWPVVGNVGVSVGNWG